MKKISIVLAILTVTLFSCENPVSKKIKETKNAVSNTKNAYKELDKLQEDIEDLKDETPLTNEEMKGWLPDEVKGMKRIAYSAGQTSYMNISSINATYANQDKSKKFEITVMDGAGEIGATATASIRMMLSMDMEEEDEYKIKKTVKKNNTKAIQEYKKQNNNTSIQMMHGKRFYLQVNATNMNVDETWDAIESLDIDDLG